MRLASYFIDENLRLREAQAVGTSDFLEAELQNMKTRLEEVEAQLKRYRESYMGELPEQLDSNLRILDRLQEHFGEVQQNLSEAKIQARGACKMKPLHQGNNPLRLSLARTIGKRPMISIR